MSEVWTKLIHDDKHTTVIRGQNTDAIVDSVRELQKDEVFGTKDLWHVGRIPFILLEIWCHEAGVLMSDTHAVEEILRRKLMDGEFSKLRVKEGSF